MLSCRQCGKELTVPARGRRPRYCSRACQARAYRARAAGRAGDGPPPAVAESKGALTVDRIVRAAIAIADAEGLEALSMRRVATALDAGTMSLYRHVPGKEELIDLMAGYVLGRAEPPLPATGGWRERVEAYARAMWALYHRHPWLLRILTVTRPRLVPNGLARTEWLLRGVEGLSDDLPTMLRAAVTVTGYVQGMAMFLVNDQQAEQRTGVGKDEWWQANRGRFHDLVTGGPYPILARIAESGEDDAGLEEEFEFGLQRLLDGLAAHLGQAPR
ncbi:TetR/AcrR family transcriptional regulator [Nonomuraea sp. SBT364]|uniref:TetR/AcrR family transcriptional regulator n=1 Tax=Nonomuraea sp. SBT364 TaxID=1580530 RepID=UPI00066C99B8|nr:TetR/AcrR family transcriptional regulator [Nonomuraea sp. SBT364]